MLEQLRLENFKGHNKVQVDFGRITILIGPNGTGKSSMSHALIALKQSIGLPDLSVTGSLINLGTFDDVLNKGSSERQIGIGLSVGVAEYPTLGIPEETSFSYDAHFEPSLVSFDVTIRSPHREHLIADMKPGETSGTVEAPELLGVSLPSGRISFELKTHRRVARPLMIASHSYPKTLTREGIDRSEKINQLISSIETVLGLTYYVPAIRGLERADYELATQPSMDVASGQNALLASNFAYAGRAAEEIVSIWSESITGSELESVILPGRKVGIESSAARGGIPVIGDGFGTNQLVHLLVTLALVPQQSVIAVEEPEIHLHPKAQEKLCDVLVDVAKAHHMQLLITTHSEHILFAFVSAVRNGSLTRDELAIYYFEEKGGQPRQVEQDECGDIYDWGKNFFSAP